LCISQAVFDSWQMGQGFDDEKVAFLVRGEEKKQTG
jgi:hypothetical protein